jgi:thiol-disulfide isomerase/thioredoxin
MTQTGTSRSAPGSAASESAGPMAGGRGTENDAGRAYRFTRLALALVISDMRFESSDPGPGDAVPWFDLPTLDGRRFRSDDLSGTGPVLMVFGSSTCPVTDDAAPGLRDLHRRFGDRVRFIMVNVREAHPGSSIRQPVTMRSKAENACMLQALHEFPFEVAIDDIDGTLHRALGPKPNSAYILGRDNTIVFRAHWASDTVALASALSSVAAGRTPAPDRAGGVMRASLRMLPHLGPTLDRAGRSAWYDMWRVAPPLAGLAAAMKLLRIRPVDGPPTLEVQRVPAARRGTTV